MKSFKFLLIAAGLFTTSLLSCTFQLRAQAFTQTIYDESSGFDANLINDIVRDGKGFLWLATDKGLLRFDGMHFNQVKTGQGIEPAILNMRIFGHLLYLVTEGAGVRKLDLKSYLSTTIATGQGRDVVLLPDSSEVVLFTNGDLVRYAAGKPVARNSLGDVPVGTAPLGRMAYFMGKLIVVTKTSAFDAFDPATLRLLQEIDMPCCNIFTPFQQTGDGLRISSPLGNFLIRPDLSVRRVSVVPPSDSLYQKDLIQWSSTGYFYLNRERELVRISGNRIDRFAIDIMRAPGIKAIFVSDSANVLLGTASGLVHVRISSPAISSFDTDLAATAPEFRVRRSIISLGDGRYALLGNPGILLWDGGSKVSRVMLPDVFATNSGIRVGGRLFATDETPEVLSFDIRSGQTKEIRLPGSKISDRIVYISADEASDKLILGSEGRVIMTDFNASNIEKVGLLDSASVRVIKRMPSKKGWWIGTTIGLFVLDNDLRTIDRKQAKDGLLRGSAVSDILFTSPDSAWVTHDQGAELVHVPSLKTLDSLAANAFPDPRVTAVLRDGNGRLWFSTFRGILGFDPHTRSTIKLTSRNGTLLNREFNYNSSLALPDGRLMFGGLSGYDLVDPDAFQFNRSVNEGRIAGYLRVGENGTVIPYLQDIDPSEIRFNTELESLRILISTRQALTASENAYEFRINSGNWTTFDAKLPLEIYKLRPGDYKLEIRAFDSFGVLINFPVITLRSEIVFYKSVAFIWSVSLLIALMAALIIFIIRRSRRRERLIKENISMDLHDELGTILTKSLLLFRTGDQTDRRMRAEEYLQDGLRSLRVFITTMKNTRIEFEQLVVDIKGAVLSSFPYDDVATEVVSPGPTSGTLDSDLYRDIKLCLFEVISNILKHASASRVSVRIERQSNGISIRVSDNGCLTGTNDLEGKGSGTGNLRKRTEKYGGFTRFSITDGAHGLTTDLFFPC